jgi:hypothetical protein
MKKKNLYSGPILGDQYLWEIIKDIEEGKKVDQEISFNLFGYINTTSQETKVFDVVYPTFYIGKEKLGELINYFINNDKPLFPHMATELILQLNFDTYTDVIRSSLFNYIQKIDEQGEIFKEDREQAVMYLKSLNNFRCFVNDLEDATKTILEYMREENERMKKKGPVS